MSDGLAIPRPRTAAAQRRPLIRPVSQVSLMLSDQNAFDVAIAETILWMNARSRCDGSIPSNAADGVPFDLTHIVGAMPAVASVFDDGTQRIWSSKLDFPDRTVGQRTWSTEISLLQQGASTNLVARLTNITRGDNPWYAPSVPGLVRRILEKLSVEADNFPISDEPFYVDENTQSDFEHLLLNKTRLLPVLAFSENESGACLFDPEIAIRRLAGAAHVVRLSSESSWDLTRTYGQRYSVFGGAVRLYSPQFDPDSDDQYRHPLRRAAESFDQEDYLEWLCGRILPRSFTRLGAATELIRVVDTQNLVSKKAREAVEGTTQTGELKTLVSSLEASLAASETQRRDDVEAAQTLLDEEAEKRQFAEQERDEIAGENDRLRAKLRALGSRNTNPTPAAIPNLVSFEEFESWADANLGDHMEITSRAIRETEKHGNLEVISKIQDTLLAIRDFYIPMKLQNKEGAWEAFREKLLGIGVDESACFAQKNDIKNFPGYQITFGGRKIWLDRHFKFGNGYDLRRMFRIYYNWDEESRTFIIGHMPTHLSNNVTD